MKIHLVPINDSELLGLLHLRAEHSQHTLTSDPAEAELLLFAGNFATEPGLILDHPLYRTYPEKSAVYNEDDFYLPLLPGVYCSAHLDIHSRIGRIFSSSYVTGFGKHANTFVGAKHSSADKTLLLSFQGGSTSMVRKRLFNLNFGRPDIVIEDTSTYRHWESSQKDKSEQQQRYAATMAASHFVLCPRGAGTGSIRFFETMRSGIAPVLIADNYALPPHIDWDAFLLRVPENQIGQLPALLEPHRSSSAERGRLAYEAWAEHFGPEKEFDTIVANCAASLRHAAPSEASFRRKQRSQVFLSVTRRKGRQVLRAGVLKAMKIARIKSPYRIVE